MRRKFIAFLMIIVVFAATGAILCGELVTGNSQVQFTKDVKVGDESVLPGATFKAAFYYDHDYYWTTYMPLNNSDDTITRSGKYASVEEENRYSYLAELSTFNYCGASGIFIPLDETDYGTDNISNVYGDMLNAVSEEAGNDFETETIVNLRDYYDSYRLYFDFLDDSDGTTLFDEFEKVNDSLNDYLYIPLPDESNVLVNMEKDSDGRLISYSIDSAEGETVRKLAPSYNKQGRYIRDKNG